MGYLYQHDWVNIRNVAIWPRVFRDVGQNLQIRLIRRYYYTSAPRDEVYRNEVIDKLKGMRIEDVKVFKKSRTRGSKRVDISLTTDMLLHAFNKNYEVAILITGDEDFVPVVDAVKATGRNVIVWFFGSGDGTSENLRRVADFFADITVPVVKRDYV